MRKALVLWLATAPMALAGAQTPPMLPALLPGEVLLQIAATGEDRRPADDIATKLIVRATGATAGEARAALNGKVSEVIAGLAKVGVGRTAISIGTPTVTVPTVPVNRGANAAAGVPAAPQSSSNETLTVRIASAAQLQAVDSVVDGRSIVVSGTPNLALKDDHAARAAATADAYARAIEAARLQASLLGMHVARPVRVRNYGPMGDLDMLTQPFIQMVRAQRGDDSAVTTTARIYIDFAMAPNT